MKKQLLARDSDRLCVIDDNEKFTRALKRDVLLLVGFNLMLVIIGVVVLYFSIKNDW